MAKRPDSPVSPLLLPARPLSPCHHLNATERAEFAQAGAHDRQNYNPNNVPVYAGLFPAKQGPGGDGTLEERLRGRGGTKGRAEWLAANARMPIGGVQKGVYLPLANDVAMTEKAKARENGWTNNEIKERRREEGGCCIAM